MSPMIAVGRVLPMLLAVLLVAGCTRVVDGAVRPAAGLKPRPLSGETVKRVLLDDTELSKMFRQAFQPDPRLPPRFGGPDRLSRSNAVPPECVGVVYPLNQSVYSFADVQVFAEENWRIAGGPERRLFGVDEGVAALPAAADAEKAFAQFSRQWDACNGVTVQDSALGGRISLLTDQISDVRTADNVLLATLTSGGGMFGIELTDVRALGVSQNCLIEVRIGVLSDDPGDPQASALDVARAMMDNVSQLS